MLKTVTAASVTVHNIGTATSLQRGQPLTVSVSVNIFVCYFTSKLVSTG